MEQENPLECEVFRKSEKSRRSSILKAISSNVPIEDKAGRKKDSKRISFSNNLLYQEMLADGTTRVFHEINKKVTEDIFSPVAKQNCSEVANEDDDDNSKLFGNRKYKKMKCLPKAIAKTYDIKDGEDKNTLFNTFANRYNFDVSCQDIEKEVIKFFKDQSMDMTTMEQEPPSSQSSDYNEVTIETEEMAENSTEPSQSEFEQDMDITLDEQTMEISVFEETFFETDSNNSSHNDTHNNTSQEQQEVKKPRFDLIPQLTLPQEPQKTYLIPKYLKPESFLFGNASKLHETGQNILFSTSNKKPIWVTLKKPFNFLSIPRNQTMRDDNGFEEICPISSQESETNVSKSDDKVSESAFLQDHKKTHFSTDDNKNEILSSQNSELDLSLNQIQATKLTSVSLSDKKNENFIAEPVINNTSKIKFFSKESNDSQKKSDQTSFLVDPQTNEAEMVNTEKSEISLTLNNSQKDCNIVFQECASINETNNQVLSHSNKENDSMLAKLIFNANLSKQPILKESQIKEHESIYNMTSDKTTPSSIEFKENGNEMSLEKFEINSSLDDSQKGLSSDVECSTNYLNSQQPFCRPKEDNEASTLQPIAVSIVESNENVTLNKSAHTFKIVSSELFSCEQVCKIHIESVAEDFSNFNYDIERPLNKTENSRPIAANTFTVTRQDKNLIEKSEVTENEYNMNESLVKTHCIKTIDQQSINNEIAKKESPSKIKSKLEPVFAVSEATKEEISLPNSNIQQNLNKSASVVSVTSNIFTIASETENLISKIEENQIEDSAQSEEKSISLSKVTNVKVEDHESTLKIEQNQPIPSQSCKESETVIEDPVLNVSLSNDSNFSEMEVEDHESTCTMTPNKKTPSLVDLKENVTETEIKNEIATESGHENENEKEIDIEIEHEIEVENVGSEQTKGDMTMNKSQKECISLVEQVTSLNQSNNRSVMLEPVQQTEDVIAEIIKSPAFNKFGTSLNSDALVNQNLKIDNEIVVESKFEDDHKKEDFSIFNSDIELTLTKSTQNLPSTVNKSTLAIQIEHSTSKDEKTKVEDFTDEPSAKKRCIEVNIEKSANILVNQGEKDLAKEENILKAVNEIEPSFAKPEDKKDDFSVFLSNYTIWEATAETENKDSIENRESDRQSPETEPELDFNALNDSVFQFQENDANASYHSLNESQAELSPFSTSSTSESDNSTDHLTFKDNRNSLCIMAEELEYNMASFTLGDLAGDISKFIDNEALSPRKVFCKEDVGLFADRCISIDDAGAIFSFFCGNFSLFVDLADYDQSTGAIYVNNIRLVCKIAELLEENKCIHIKENSYQLLWPEKHPKLICILKRAVFGWFQELESKLNAENAGTNLELNQLLHEASNMFENISGLMIELRHLSNFYNGLLLKFDKDYYE